MALSDIWNSTSLGLRQLSLLQLVLSASGSLQLSYLGQQDSGLLLRLLKGWGWILLIDGALILISNSGITCSKGLSKCNCQSKLMHRRAKDPVPLRPVLLHLPLHSAFHLSFSLQKAFLMATF